MCLCDALNTERTLANNDDNDDFARHEFDESRTHSHSARNEEAFWLAVKL